jgi:aromatic ring-cleaving dioxygenase
LANDFASFVLDAYGISDVPLKNVATLLHHSFYIAHPRMKTAHPWMGPVIDGEELSFALVNRKDGMVIRSLDVSPEKSSFRDQLQAIRESRVIVAFHGPTLTHLLFSRDDAAIIELTIPELWPRHTYMQMSRHLGRTHLKHCLPHDDPSQKVYVDPQQFARLIDWLAPQAPVLLL